LDLKVGGIEAHSLPSSIEFRVAKGNAGTYECVGDREYAFATKSIIHPECSGDIGSTG
jgi:hypothetical protein